MVGKKKKMGIKQRDGQLCWEGDLLSRVCGGGLLGVGRYFWRIRILSWRTDDKFYPGMMPGAPMRL